MKKLGTMALALALTASLALPAPAAAAEPAVPPAGGPAAETAAAYRAALTLNGETLDVTGVPAASSSGMLPLRLLAEADHGSASWFEEENQGFFYLSDVRITVNFADCSILVNDEAVEGAAEVVRGVTFIPAAVLGGIEGFSVETDPRLDAYRLDVTTPNGAPLMKLAYEVMDVSAMGRGMKTDPAVLEENYHLPLQNFEEVAAFFPMITSPDTLILGKLAKDADLDAVKAALEAYRQSQEDTFSWYLAQNLPKVQDARTVVEGDYLLFLIAEDADKGVEAFKTFAAAQAG